jgi:hypothetical protein
MAGGVTTTRRLAAILAADVAGYSRLIGADEDGTLQPLKAIRAELLARWTPSRSSCARTASGFVRWYHCKCQTTITGYERWCALGLRWRGLHF